MYGHDPLWWLAPPKLIGIALIILQLAACASTLLH